MPGLDDQREREAAGNPRGSTYATPMWGPRSPRAEQQRPALAVRQHSGVRSAGEPTRHITRAGRPRSVASPAPRQRRGWARFRRNGPPRQPWFCENGGYAQTSAAGPTGGPAFMSREVSRPNRAGPWYSPPAGPAASPAPRAVVGQSNRRAFARRRVRSDCRLGTDQQTRSDAPRGVSAQIAPSPHLASMNEGLVSSPSPVRCQIPDILTVRRRVNAGRVKRLSKSTEVNSKADGA